MCETNALLPSSITGTVYLTTALIWLTGPHSVHVDTLWIDRPSSSPACIVKMWNTLLAKYCHFCSNCHAHNAAVFITRDTNMQHVSLICCRCRHGTARSNVCTFLPTTSSYHPPVNSLTLRRLMSYIYGAPILDVSRSHTMTQHSR